MTGQGKACQPCQAGVLPPREAVEDDGSVNTGSVISSLPKDRQEGSKTTAARPVRQKAI